MPDHVEAIIQTSTGDWLQCGDPARIVVAHLPEAVRPALAEVERLTRDLGLHAVGFVTYEAGLAFGLQTHRPSDPALVPLVWFGLFETKDVRVRPRPVREGQYRLGPLSPSIDRSDFQQAFEAIKRHLAAGDTYQANFTFKMTGEFEGEPVALFADLIDAQRGRHCAFLRAGNWAVCSASPELFFDLDGVEIRARPMKGTARRGLTVADDNRRRDELHRSAKQRAENVMIVDMIRNDLGRVAQIGSVEVPELFVVEQYPNVWQMTSLVTARSLASLEDIFAAMHPSASVTGAPKVRTMAILSELESAPRGIYTGSIGYVPPDGNASFNVAIRTAVVDLAARRVEFGIGSGIVWDSDAAAEYEECLLKGSVIGRPPVRFELLETLRWSAETGYFLLERHLDRMRESAGYFEFAFDDEAVRGALSETAKVWREPQRVRLLLARDGVARVESTLLVAQTTALRVGLAAEPIDRENGWLYHKTTHREAYERARRESPQFDEVILWNSSGEVTEATTANVVVELAGNRLTPPVASGLLAGTFRAELLQKGAIEERVVTVEDLRTSSRIWLINSVHEWREATLHM